MQATNPPVAQGLRMTEQELILCVGSKEYTISWEACSERLAQASEQQRQCAELSPGGYGIHWPQIDEDLSVGGLLRRCQDR